MDDTILEIKGISKAFGKVIANDSINFTLKKGEIHSILGENGSGKSTLMNIISGLYKPDKGTISLNGKKQNFKNPRDSIKSGIGMIHQHFMLIPNFSVTENIILGDEVTKGIELDLKNARKKIIDISSKYGLPLEPDSLIETLPVGIQQRVEIIKVLFRDISVLILDEPTAVLTPDEVNELFKVLKQLSNNNVSIIFISHKLKEVLSISDRISVIRKGRIVDTITPYETDEKELASLMVGREVLLQVEKENPEIGEVVFEAKNIFVSDKLKGNIVNNLSLEIHSGEILGIAGIQGNGQTELAETITGLRKLKKGELYFKGEKLDKISPRILNEKGFAHIPEDRLKHGLVLPYSISENQFLCSYHKYPFSRFKHLNLKRLFRESKKLIDRFDIRTTGPDAPVKNLSGGNQQKVIVSRELNRDIKFLVANQPSRGLDVGSIEYIHSKIIELRNSGGAVLLISSELDEIIALSDRIAVMFSGEIVNVLDSKKVSKKELGLLMTGSK